MTQKVTIWHYPQCSKSRKTLAILRDEGLDVEIRRYRVDPPDANELKEAIDQLGIAPRQLVRTNEDIVQDLDVASDQLGDADWIELMAEHPVIIERPVVFGDGDAALGRPPESIYEILPSTTEG